MPLGFMKEEEHHRIVGGLQQQIETRDSTIQQRETEILRLKGELEKALQEALRLKGELDGIKEKEASAKRVRAQLLLDEGKAVQFVKEISDNNKKYREMLAVIKNLYINKVSAIKDLMGATAAAEEKIMKDAGESASAAKYRDSYWARIDEIYLFLLDQRQGIQIFMTRLTEALYFVQGQASQITNLLASDKIDEDAETEEFNKLMEGLFVERALDEETKKRLEQRLTDIKRRTEINWEIWNQHDANGVQTQFINVHKGEMQRLREIASEEGKIIQYNYKIKGIIQTIIVAYVSHVESLLLASAEGIQKKLREQDLIRPWKHHEIGEGKVEIKLSPDMLQAIKADMNFNELLTKLSAFARDVSTEVRMIKDDKKLLVRLEGEDWQFNALLRDISDKESRIGRLETGLKV